MYTTYTIVLNSAYLTFWEARIMLNYVKPVDKKSFENSLWNIIL
jgi:hypothetical protein